MDVQKEFDLLPKYEKGRVMEYFISNIEEREIHSKYNFKIMTCGGTRNRRQLIVRDCDSNKMETILNDFVPDGTLPEHEEKYRTGNIYKIILRNPIVKRIDVNEICVEYNSEKYSVSLRFTVTDEIVELLDLATGEMAPTESTEVYFTRISRAEIRKMRVLRYTFGNRKETRWYGGDITLQESERVTEIVNLLLRK